MAPVCPAPACSPYSARRNTGRQPNQPTDVVFAEHSQLGPRFSRDTLPPTASMRKYSGIRPRLSFRTGTRWRTTLVIVKPETVIAWHRRGFRLWWAWRSRRQIGRPTVPTDIRTLIREMANANPRWGAPRIHGELLKLGIDVCQATVAKYLVRGRQPPSHTWRTFMRNHVGQIVAADFFVVPTATS